MDDLPDRHGMDGDLWVLVDVDAHEVVVASVAQASAPVADAAAPAWADAVAPAVVEAALAADVEAQVAVAQV